MKKFGSKNFNEESERERDVILLKIISKIKVNNEGKENKQFFSTISQSAAYFRFKYPIPTCRWFSQYSVFPFSSFDSSESDSFEVDLSVQFLSTFSLLLKVKKSLNEFGSGKLLRNELPFLILDTTLDTIVFVQLQMLKNCVVVSSANLPADKSNFLSSG